MNSTPDTTHATLDTETFIKNVKFDDNGLIPAVAQDAAGGQVLMLAWMSREALEQTLATGRVTYWSRSRQALWRKGDTSGHVQHLKEIYLDCDGDALLLKVDQSGPACHTGAPHCFFHKLNEVKIP